MMSRRFSDAQNYYQRMKELQEKLKQSEDDRMRLEKKFNKILQTVRAEDRMRKLSSAKDNYMQLIEEDRMRSDRNDSLMQILDRIENRACSINAKTERLRLLRKHYEAYMERTYPGWKANESKFYESYNEKLKAINSHFRTLSNDYTDLPTWRTSQDMDASRDDISTASAYSIANSPHTSYLNTSSFNIPDQNEVRINNMTGSNFQPPIYNNFNYTPLSRESLVQVPTSSNLKDSSNLGSSYKTSNYTLNNLTTPIKSSFISNYSKPTSIVSDLDSETFQLNNDISLPRTTRQSNADLDKDFNTRSDYFANDIFDRTASNSQINSYSPRFSRYDSGRQTLKYSHNPISPVGKFSNKYSRPSSYDKNYSPKSLTRSASLDTFTSKYSPRYRYTSPTSYSGDRLYRSNSLGRIPQETKSTYSSHIYDYGVGYYKKYSPRTRIPERKSYSTLSTTSRIPSDAGYFSHRSTSPANSATYSSYNTPSYGYSRYNSTPRLTRSNSIQKNYDPPYTTTSRRNVASNLPYMSTLSRSQSFSEIDDLDYLSRKKNYDMSGWNQYPMGRERFYYDGRNSNNYPQYSSAYSPEPAYNAKNYSFQADKSTSTDDGYDEDRSMYGRRINRVHYADEMNNTRPTLNYNDYTTERLLDNSRKIYDRDPNPQRDPNHDLGVNTRGISEETLKTTDIHDRNKLSSKEEPSKTSTNVSPIKNGSSMDEYKPPTTLPYSQQILQTLEERTEEDITQSTSENPSLGSEQHWENEIGKLKDIMNYDSQPQSFVSGDGKDHNTSKEPYNYYNKSGHSPSTTTEGLVKPVSDQTGKPESVEENSQMPDLKQEIEMLKRKKETTLDNSDDFIYNGASTHPSSANEYYQNENLELNQHPLQPPYYSDPNYSPYTSEGNIEKIPQEKFNYHSQPTEVMNDNIHSRVSPSHNLEESHVLEKQDQPEKYDKKYKDKVDSNRELNKSPIDYHSSRQISPVPQIRDRDRLEQGDQHKKQMILPIQDSSTNNSRDKGQISPRSLQTSDKSPHQSKNNIDDNQIGNTRINKQSNGVKPGKAMADSQAEKVSKVHSSSQEKLNSSIGMSQNPLGVSNQNQKSSHPTQPDIPKISSDNGSSSQLANVQNTNAMQRQTTGMKYDHTQPSLQMPDHDNQQNKASIPEEIIKQQSPINVSQNYQPQQLSNKEGIPQINPITSAPNKEQNQQLGDEVSLQQNAIPDQQQYEQPQHQNFEEREAHEQYNYNETGGDGYQPQYDNSNAYQYNEEQAAQQYPNIQQPHQQYQEPQYAQQEQYPQTQEGQYNPQQDGQYPHDQEGQYLQQDNQYLQQQDGQYPQHQEGQYLQQQDGQYPQQPDDQYPQQQEGQYPQQQDDQYPQQPDDQYPQQQEGQYPQPQEDQYPQQQQDIQYVQQQGDQYPQQEYPQKPMENYAPPQDQYPPQYSQDNMASNQLPIERQYPEGEVPERFPENPNDQQYLDQSQPYTGEQQQPQQYMQGENQQPYQDGGQYGQQYGDGQHYPNEQYANYQQDQQAYPENYYEQQPGYEGYNEQAQEHYQQNPDQYNATKPQEQFYPDGQAAVDNKDQQPSDQYQPTEQTLPSAGNYDQQQVEQQSAPIPEKQSADNRPTDVLQDPQDKDLNRVQEENQQERSKVEPEKPPSPESFSKVESDKKAAEVKTTNSPKPEGNIPTTTAESAPAATDKPTPKQPPTASKAAAEKTAEGKPDSKSAPASAPSKTADSGGGKPATRAAEKKGGAEAGGKSAGAAKSADGKPATKSKAGEKIGGLKGAAAAARTASKLQK
ncbi:uncharacterized protein LOC120350297 [Nilaparvata lugens]|uniref:uncharacterized protein LOC120350297 n=1 Tax=Nilaparvata lugens TaxID=108931 RepID=UPI00193C99BA|nr:uncharacterized protein LOC120350297 [Nilaparvata lugens]